MPIRPGRDCAGWKRGQIGRMDSRAEITDLLIAWREGDEASLERLTRLVYEELRRIARSQRAAERADHTLSPTALVHEAYMRLVELNRIDWRDRKHFFGVASSVMRRVLVDHARRYRAAKRDGGKRVELDAVELSLERHSDELLAVDAALSRLAEVDERLARIVECRYFAGMKDEDTAELLGVSVRTVRRDWAKARGWLYQELGQ